MCCDPPVAHKPFSFLALVGMSQRRPEGGTCPKTRQSKGSRRVRWQKGLSGEGRVVPFFACQDQMPGITLVEYSAKGTCGRCSAKGPLVV